MTYNDSMDTISIDEILKDYENWGVPHFQRGSVWSVDNVSALLESLYHDTPCGSIILWAQTNAQYGVPLVSGRSFKYLIIDGQQRARSVYAAFKGVFDAAEESVGERDGDNQNQEGEFVGEKFWAINLNVVPDFKNVLAPPAKRVSPLFVRIPNPAMEERNRVERVDARRRKGENRYNIPESAYKYNFILLSHFEDGRFDALLEKEQFFLRYANGPDDRPVALAKLEDLRGKIQEMRRRRLFLKRLGEGVDLYEAVQVFIRINSGGRPVQEEERAFSALVERCPTTNEAIERLFTLVHGRARRKGSPHNGLIRDEALARMNERSFGFKLFIRVFVLACSYHAGWAVGATSLSFGVLRDPRLLATMAGGGGKYGELWRGVSDVVVAMRDLLREHLKLDALQFLPDAGSLTPLFLALVKYPGLMDDRGTDRVRVKENFQASFAYLALALLLSGASGRQLMNWTSLMAKSHSDADTELKKLAREVKPSRKLLEQGLAAADSLTNRYTLLLYGLERSRKACDFSYERNNLKGVGFGETEVTIGEDCHPEKQHIVPYSRLDRVYNFASKSRLSSTKANNIGNITYISRMMNSLNGLSDRMLNFDSGDESHPGNGKVNLKAHILSTRALRAYKKVKKLVGEEDGTLVKQAYEQWISLRQADLCKGFLDWAESFLNQWDAMRSAGCERIEPVRPDILDVRYGSLAHPIRELGLPDATEDKIIAIFTQDGWRLDPGEGASGTQRTLSLVFRLKRKVVIRGVRLSREELWLPEIGKHAGETVYLTREDESLESLKRVHGRLRKYIRDQS